MRLARHRAAARGRSPTGVDTGSSGRAGERVASWTREPAPLVAPRRMAGTHLAAECGGSCHRPRRTARAAPPASCQRRCVAVTATTSSRTSCRACRSNSWQYTILRTSLAVRNKAASAAPREATAWAVKGKYGCVDCAGRGDKRAAIRNPWQLIHYWAPLRWKKQTEKRTAGAPYRLLFPPWPHTLQLLSCHRHPHTTDRYRVKKSIYHTERRAAAWGPRTGWCGWPHVAHIGTRPAAPPRASARTPRSPSDSEGDETPSAAPHTPSSSI